MCASHSHILSPAPLRSVLVDIADSAYLHSKARNDFSGIFNIDTTHVQPAAGVHVPIRAEVGGSWNLDITMRTFSRSIWTTTVGLIIC